MLLRTLLTCSLVVAAASSASAQGVCAAGSPGVAIGGRSTGLSTPFRSYDFNGIESAFLGVPFASSVATPGLTFDGARLGSPAASIYSSFPNTFVDGAIYSYGFAQDRNARISVLFDVATRGAAFNFAAAAGRTSFTAWKRGAAPNSFVELARIDVRLPAVSSESRSCWWGFDFGEGGAFDKLTVESAPEPGSPFAFGIDNLQVALPSTSVPEPATLGLLLVGLAAIGAVFLRQQRT